MPGKRWPDSVWVALGGLAGCLLRFGIGLRWPTPAGHWPTATFLINLVGCVLLGLLLESLARSGPDRGRRRSIRLLLGPGLLGTFTTYSTLAVETDLLVRGGHLPLALGYAVVSVIAGVAAAAVGVAAGAALHRRVPVTAGDDRE